jgi:hypothetical protein
MLTIGEGMQTFDPLEAEYRQILTPESLQFPTKLQKPSPGSPGIAAGPKGTPAGVGSRRAPHLFA